MATSFDGRREFTHIDLRGAVDVTCFDGGQVKRSYHQCSGYLLQPRAYAHFYHNTEVQADRVALTVQHQNKETVQKRSTWDNANKRSTDAFNLWVWTVFQRPLLELGENVISFDLTQAGRSVARGDFKVSVKDGGVRECRYRRITTGNEQLCENAMSACTEYFDLENNCVY
jgi:hypothetical protein